MKSIKVKVLKMKKKDSDKVAKIVIYNQEDEILFLKRTNYVPKFAGELDLPGGHLTVGEEVLDGLRREVKEETGISNLDPVFLEKVNNKSFFFSKFSGESINLSHEHENFLFIAEEDFEKHSNLKGLFKQIALKALKKIKND
jgi:8-oxo-dGTP pyrophosphatase MutT (NUDIX family)